RGNTERLAESFIVSENKCAIFFDWRSCRAAELIALERRNYRTIKEISSIESAVAQKLIQRAMERVFAGACNHVDYAARGSSVVGWIIAAKDRNLLHGIDSKIVAEYAARCAIRIIVDADSIQTVTILIRPR